MKRDVAFVSYVQYPSFVGLSYRLKGISNALSKQTVRCEIVCPSDSRCPSPERIGDVFIRGVRIPHSLIGREKAFGLRFLGMILFWIKAIPILVGTVIKNHTIIFEQSFTLPLIMFTRLISRRKCIVDDLIITQVDKQGVLRFVWSLIDLMTLACTQKIITASPITQSFIESRRIQKPMLFLPNGCTPIEGRNRLQSDDESSNKKAVLVGSLSFDQNLVAIQHAIKLSRRIEQKVSGFEIDIIGGPKEKLKEIHGGTNRIPVILNFLGFLSEDELHNAYLKAQIGLLPFFNDTPLVGGSRTKALEYFAYGLLVISGEEGIGGLPGIIPGVHYIIANNIDSFSEKLMNAISNPDHFEDIRLSAYEMVKSKYAWNKLVLSLLEFLDK
ncbi:MAG: glycosyltransferase family 4 protein [Candidatus Thorarchaeota archaeon]